MACRRKSWIGRWVREESRAKWLPLNWVFPPGFLWSAEVFSPASLQHVSKWLFFSLCPEMSEGILVSWYIEERQRCINVIVLCIHKSIGLGRFSWFLRAGPKQDWRCLGLENLLQPLCCNTSVRSHGQTKTVWNWSVQLWRILWLLWLLKR